MHTAKQSLAALDNISQRLRIFTVAQAYLPRPLTTTDLLQANTWIDEFFHHINNNLFPIYNLDFYEDEGATEGIHICPFIDNYWDEELDDQEQWLQVGRQLNERIYAETAALPVYYEIEQKGWRYVYQQFLQQQSKSLAPLRLIPLIITILDKQTDNPFWDYSSEHYNEPHEWTANNLISLKRAYCQARRQLNRLEELNKWLAKGRNEQKVIKLWCQSVTTAHKLYPRPLPRAC
ncbi:MAG: hypothetical protein JST84_04660 [Acidobacteria bacterium]|nr:hypothetical protein [Acidobacteriota bacterium]